MEPGGSSSRKQRDNRRAHVSREHPGARVGRAWRSFALSCFRRGRSEVCNRGLLVLLSSFKFSNKNFFSFISFNALSCVIYLLIVVRVGRHCLSDDVLLTMISMNTRLEFTRALALVVRTARIILKELLRVKLQSRAGRRQGRFETHQWVRPEAIREHHPLPISVVLIVVLVGRLHLICTESLMILAL